MELGDYLHGLRRFWYVLLACMIVGTLCGFVYNKFTYLDEADAYVAVVSPKLAAASSGATQAQVSFGAIMQSYSLAGIVAKHIGESQDDVYNDLTVSTDASLSTGSVSSGATPLIVITGRDHGLDRAIKLVNTAVADGRDLYIKFNGVDGGDLKAGLAKQQTEVQGELDQAEAAQTKFENDNNAVDLPNKIASQRERVNALTLEVATANAEQTGDYYATFYVDANNYTRDYNRYATLNGQLATEQAELDRLQGLLPQYNTLQFQVESAQTRVQDFNAQEQAILVGQLLPAQNQVKVMDSGRVHSQTLFLLLIYGLGFITGLILGLCAIYVLARMHTRPASAEEVAEAFSVPVLVRIPRAR